MIIKYFLRQIKYNFLQRRYYKKLKNKFAKSGSMIRKPLVLSDCCDFVDVGTRVRVHQNVRISCYYEFAGEKLKPHIVLSDGVIIGYEVSLIVTDELVIGENTILAGGVLITTEDHGINPEVAAPYYAQPLVNRPVSIGSNCWIGQNTMILKGVKIGNNCIVGAGSVVTKSFPDNCIIVGNPARILKKYNYEKHAWESVN